MTSPSSPHITCTRRLQFSAGHRVYLHESKCAHMHGHNYVVYLEAESPQLDSVGRVIDFGVLKDLLGSWIDKFWDHGFIYFQGDNELEYLFNTGLLSSHKSYELPLNPTAENMALYLLGVIGPEVLSETDVRLISVTLYETENCYATARL